LATKYPIARTAIPPIPKNCCLGPAVALAEAEEMKERYMEVEAAAVPDVPAVPVPVVGVRAFFFFAGFHPAPRWGK